MTTAVAPSESVVENIAEALAALPEDLATATPPQIDGALAALDRIGSRPERVIESAVDHLHHIDGQKGQRRRYGGFTTWPKTGAETEDSVRAKVATDDPALSYHAHTARRTLGDLDTARADLAAVRAASAPLNAQWQERQWSRFFLVQNTGGHVHKDMRCGTCRPTTRYGWLTELSGLTEADAVDAHGPLLCSVCYPSAPVEWTTGLPPKVDPRSCPGTRPVEGSVSWRYRTASGKCAECQTTQVVTSTGKIRKHRKPE